MASTVGSSSSGILPLAIAAFFLFFFLVGRRLGLKGKQQGRLVDLPIVRMLPSLLLNLHHVHDWMTSTLREYGCNLRFAGPRLSGMSYVLTADPAVVKHVTGTNFGNYIRGPRFREILAPLGDSIITSDFDDWKIRRRLAQELLHRPEFLQFVRVVTLNKLENGLLPLLANIASGEHMVDLQDVLRRFTFDVTCLLVFGVEVGTLSPSFPVVPFAKAVDVVEEVLVFRYAVPRSWWRFLRWIRMGPEKKLAESMEYLDSFVYQLITSRKSELSKDAAGGAEKGATAPVDLLTSYIRVQMADETRKSMSDKFLRDSTGELLMAGRDTTSASLSWFFWLVSTNPQVETRIIEELSSVARLRRHKKKEEYVVFEPEELDRCVYLNASLRESLRLFPAIPVTQKCSLKQDVLPTGEAVQPGTVIVQSMYAMGRMEKIWGEDSREFKPERWISDEGKLREESSYKFTAFGSGPRICVGKSLGLAQLNLISATVIYNFQFQVAPDHQVSPANSAVLHMKHGLMGSLQERRQLLCSSG